MNSVVVHLCACELSVQMIMWDEFLSGCEKSVALKGLTLQEQVVAAGYSHLWFTLART